MDRIQHLTSNSIVLIPLGILLYYFVLGSTTIIVMVYLAIPIGSLFPDIDATVKRKWDEKEQKWKIKGGDYHRHWLCHSILFTGFCWVLCLQYPEFMLFVAILNFSVGLHLLEDLRFRRVGGKYTIKFYKKYSFKEKKWKMKGLNYVQTCWWLFLNFLVSLLILAFTVAYCF